MDSKGWIFFNVLINRYQANPAAFLNILPEETQESLKKNPTESSETAAALRLTEQQLPLFHYSWLIPIIQQSPAPLSSLLLNCLSPAQRQGICRQLSLSVPKTKLSAQSRRFLQSHLAKQLNITQALPLSYLPASPLSALADMSRDQLVTAIDYLGIRDLAEALRPIVDNRLLQAIHRSLKPAELQLLRAYLHQRDTLKVAKLDFAKWDGQRDSLRLLYHQRGLARLAKALAGQSKDLIWHISRHLDDRRAALLTQLGATKVSPAISQTLILQVVAVIEFLQRQSGE